MNDAPDRLYLATLLWTKVFPTFASESVIATSIRVRADEMATQISNRFGRLRTNDVRRSLDLLEDAQLAKRQEGGFWDVAWQPLRRVSERDVARVLASRACNPPGTHALDRLAEASESSEPTELTLFD